MAWKWRMLLAVIAEPPSLYKAIKVYYISSFQGIAIPLGGLGPDIVRYVHLRSSRIPINAIAASIVLERIIGITATMMIASYGALSFARRLGSESEFSTSFIWAFTISLAAATISLLLLFHKFSQSLMAKVFRVNRLKKLPLMQKTIESVQSFSYKPGEIGKNLLLSIIEQLFSVLSLYFGAMAFNISLSLYDCLAVAPISSLLQRLPISYAGIGIKEGAHVFLLGLLGVKFDNALVLSTSLFLAFLLSLLPGIIWTIGENNLSNS